MYSSTRRIGGARRSALLALVVALIAWTGLVACGGDAEATAFTLEPSGAAGDNPFMASVESSAPQALAAADPTTTAAGSQSTGTDTTSRAPAETTAVTPPAGIHGTYQGSTPGLYGGTMNQASCDVAQMVDFLEANPDKATAWAGVLGIQPDQIDTFVARLTPMILRADTAVTNHGFRDGQATELHSVLQAGTAVLVDDQGQPVVKCGCGNPLTAPPTTSARTYAGTQWKAFTPSSVIEVTRSADPLNEFVLVHDAPAPAPSTSGPTDTTTTSPTTAADGDGSRTAFARPVGTDGDADLPVTVPTGEGLTGDDPSASTTTTVGASDPTETPTTTSETAPDSTIAVATTDRYNVTLTPTAGDCLGTPPSPGIVEVVGDRVHFTSPDVVSPLWPDGSFGVISTGAIPGGAGGTSTYEYNGRLDGRVITGTLVTTVVSPTGVRFTCTVAIDGAIADPDAPVTDPPVPTTTTTTTTTTVPAPPTPTARSWYFDVSLQSNGCEDITVTDGGRGRVRVYDDGRGFQSITFLGRPSINVGVVGGRFFDATVQDGNTVTLSGPSSGALPSIADDGPAAFTYTVVNSDPSCTITFRATRTT